MPPGAKLVLTASQPSTRPGTCATDTRAMKDLDLCGKASGTTSRHSCFVAIVTVERVRCSNRNEEKMND